MIIKKDFLYPAANEIRRLHIYLPDSYDETEERYPVMYFFDGHNLYFNEDATYGKSWGLKDFLDNWQKDMIIVGIECGHGPGQRLGEYCPYTVDISFMKGITGIGDETFRWIVEEVKPMVDKEYRTYADRQCTGIAGSSMGGLMALYGAVAYNSYFSKAACVSSAIGICLSNLREDFKRYKVDSDTRVYLSWGTKEAWGVKDPNKEDTHSFTYKDNRYVGDVLKSQGAAVELDCQVGGGHCEADWEKLVPEFMDFLWMR